MFKDKIFKATTTLVSMAMLGLIILPSALGFYKSTGLYLAAGIISGGLFAAFFFALSLFSMRNWNWKHARMIQGFVFGVMVAFLVASALGFAYKKWVGFSGG